MAWWVYPVLLISSAILNRLTAPRVKPRDKDAFKFPDSREGQVVPIVYGRAEITPALIGWKDTRVRTGSDGFTSYKARMQMAVCQGPVDKLLEIKFGDKPISGERVRKNQSYGNDLNYIVNPAQTTWVRGGGSARLSIYLSALQMFGGEKKEGGVAGLVRFYWGHNNQTFSPLTVHFLGDDKASAYPELCYIDFGAAPGDTAGAPGGQLTDGQFHWSNNVGTPRPVSVIVQRIPNALGLGAVGEDANPAEIIYELLTHPDLGAGIDATDLDLTSFEDSGLVYKNEGMGLSVLMDRTTDIAAVVQDVLRHCNSTLADDPVTGKIYLKPARADYVLANVPLVDATNADNVKVEKFQWLDTYNEIKLKYRAYDSGVSGQINNEVLAEQVTFANTSFIRYQTKHRNISNVVVVNASKGNIVLTDGVEYDIPDAVSGWIRFFDSPNIDEGDKILVSYIAGGKFVGFRDAVAQAQNIANQQATQEVRSTQMDFPYYAEERLANQQVAYLRRGLSQSLDKVTWEQNRSAYGYRPGDVVRLTFPDKNLTDFPVRLSDVQYGVLENGKILCEGVEDIFGEDVPPIDPGSGGDPDSQGDQAPNMAGITCAGNSISIKVFPGDAFFNVEVERSDDANGLNATIITPADGVTAPATGLVITDVQANGVTKWYRARHVDQEGVLLPGNWTNRISCTGTADPPTDPTCTLPTISFTPVQLDADVKLLVEYTDPQQRVLDVSFRYQLNNAPQTDWVVDAAAPYEQALTLADGQSVTIEGRVRYYNCDGDLVEQTGSGGFVWPLDEEPPTNPNFGEPLCVVVPFITKGSRKTFEFWPSEVKASAVDLLPGQHIKFDFTGYSYVRMNVEIQEALLPFGSMVGLQFFNGLTWDWVGLEDGIQGPEKELHLGPLDTGLAGDWLKINPAALGDYETRAVAWGGDGLSVSRVLGRLDFEVKSGNNDDLTPPEEPEPPTDDPDPTEPDPETRSDLGIWHKSYTGVSVSGTDITQVDDLSEGPTSHATPTDSAPAPQLQADGLTAGVPSIRQWGSQGLIHPFGTRDDWTEGHLFWLLKKRPDYYYVAISASHFWGFGTPVDHYAYLDGFMYISYGSSVRYKIPGGSDVVPESWHILEIQAKDGLWKMYRIKLDGTRELLHSNTTNVFVPRRGKIGGSGFAMTSHQEWAEWIEYSKVKSEAVRDQVIEHLIEVANGNTGHVLGQPPEGGGGGGGSDGGGDPDDPGGDPPPHEPPGDVPTPIGLKLFGGFMDESLGDIDDFPPLNADIIEWGPGSIVSLLEWAETNQFRVFFNPASSRRNWTNPNGTFNFEMWKTWASRYRSIWNTILPFVTGVGRPGGWKTMPFTYLIDEPFCKQCFGGQAIPAEVVEEMARLIKLWYPGCGKVFIRVSAVQMLERRATWNYVDGCWCQFNARAGGVDFASGNSTNIDIFIAQNISAAKKLGLYIYWSLNVINGGDGRSGWPGSGDRWQMAPSEVTQYGLKIVKAIKDGYGEGIGFWVIPGANRWNYGIDWYYRPGVVTALSTVATELAAP